MTVREDACIDACACPSACVHGENIDARYIKPVCCNWAFGIARGLKEITWSQKWERESEKERERERALYTRTYHDYVYCIR